MDPGRDRRLLAARLRQVRAPAGPRRARGLLAGLQVIGRQFGLADDEMPDAIEDFDAYMPRMLESGDLHITPQARELAIEIVMRPPVPFKVRPLLELANQITVGLLPAEIRAATGCPGTRPAPSRSTAGPSTSGGSSSRCCPSWLAERAPGG